MRSRVFSPVEIGGVALRNRVFVSAHTTNFGVGFLPTDRHVAYHAERARGGAGLIITEPLRVHATSLGRAGGLSASPAALPGLTRIVDAVRAEGAAIFTQITHAGRHSENVFERSAAWGPSARRWNVAGSVPHAMARREMTEVRTAYADAARLAAKAGFQGVEIHFGHGHLLHQFISPAANTRTDCYGGDLDARLRYPLEVLDAVLDAVGTEIAVGVRMSADELVGGGQTLDEGERIAELVDTTRELAFLNVSVASYTVPSIGHHVADMSEGHTPYLAQTLAVARRCERTPVLAACRFVDLDDAERGLAAGLAAVAMTRAHIADPHLLAKAAAGRERDIRPCVSCNFCIGEIAGHRPITCMVNPAAGREADWPAVPEATGRPGRIVVVGGGAAGAEAAAVAAERGHTVTLWESGGELGGQLRTGRRGAGRGHLDRLRAHQHRRLAALGVPIRPHRAAASDVLAESPDAVVVATGAVRRARVVPGWGRALTPEEALAGRDWAGHLVLVLDDEGGWTTSSVAETVARAGARVHVVTSAGTALWAVSEYSRMTAVERLRSLGVSLWTSADADVRAGVVTITSTLTGVATEVAGVRDVVAIDPPDALDDLSGALAEAGVPVHVVGDAVAPRSLLEAVAEGHAVGRTI
ncbi:NAD(P)-binding protein [Lentzea sp. E54]|uniref:oxidoreductase n=1 Tax=Lentzea xerophila TaxID=3435883 RepID=UPI003DA39788